MSNLRLRRVAEKIKGSAYLRGMTGIGGKVTYEFELDHNAPLRRHDIASFGLSAPLVACDEEREGRYVLESNGAEKHAILSYRVIIDVSSSLIFPNECRLAIGEPRELSCTNYEMEHFFKNGEYRFTTLQGMKYLGQLHIDGMSIVTPVRGEEQKRLLAAWEEARERTYVGSREDNAAWDVVRKRIEMFKGVRVTVDDFKIPDDMKKCLKDANDDIINALLGRYLQ